MPHFHRLPHHLLLWILLVGLVAVPVLVIFLFWLVRRLSRLR
jgi:flagellar biogenesis protein FliO